MFSLRIELDVLSRLGLSARLLPIILLIGSASFFTHSDEAQAQQKRSDGNSFAKAMADTGEKPFEDRFWKYLIGNNYKNWSPGPGQSGDFYIGQNPHGALLKMYLNRTAAGKTQNFPMGSVIILENYRADRSLKSISVMYRTNGFNPNGNDWYWVDYNPDGTVVKEAVSARTGVENVSLNSGGLQKMMGRATNCMSCHQGGDGEDYVFFNDRSLLPSEEESPQRVAEQKRLELGMRKAAQQPIASTSSTSPGVRNVISKPISVSRSAIVSQPVVSQPVIKKQPVTSSVRQASGISSTYVSPTYYGLPQTGAR